MDAAVTDTISSLLGTSTQPVVQYPNQNFSTMGDPLGSTIPMRVKEKIWSNQFVELGDLLNPKFADSYSLSLSQGQGGGGAKVALIPDSKSRPIHEIERWTSAFHIYASVYMEKFPLEGPGLMKYAERVRDLARLHQGLAWRFYDFRFRQLKQCHPTLPWAMCHQEIWARATLEPRSAPAKNFRGQSAQSKRAKGFCYTYNNEGECPDKKSCRFEHSCQLCKGNHPKKECRKERHAPKHGKKAGQDRQ